jgi:predicted RecA/RadA family phage recombinase
MKNYIRPGTRLPYTVAGTAIVSGEARLVGTLLGIATGAGAVGEVVEMVVVEVYSIPAVTLDVAAVGAKAYWDDAAKKITTTVGANTLVGTFAKAKINTDTTAEVRLDGVTR